LHHVALSGNSRPIPILCAKGASVREKDRDGKTALELSTDERIREMITVYGSAKKLDRMVKTVELNQSAKVETKKIEKTDEKQDNFNKNIVQQQTRD
jgi:hypothetical protein